MHRFKSTFILALVVLFLPVLVVYVAGILLGLASWGAVLRTWYWRAHAAHGRPVLFVYSKGPNWQAYIEENILPRLRDNAVVLNWSDRRHWASASPWEARYFRHFAGSREFNPVALVYCTWGRINAVRFHQAFMDLKHGKDSALRQAEAELDAVVRAAVKFR